MVHFYISNGRGIERAEKSLNDEKPRARHPKRRLTVQPISYEVDSAAQEVQVLAIGVKDRNRLLIGGEEYES